MILYLAFFLLIQDVPEVTPRIGSTTFVDENKVQRFIKKHADYTQAALEEELLFNFYYPHECDCWGDGFYNCFYFSNSVSSSLKSVKQISYGSDNLSDLDLRTAWVEGTDGYGIGESITYNIEMLDAPDIVLKEIVIVNGYVKNQSAWINNSRVKKMRLIVNGKPKAILKLSDVANYQIFDIEKYVTGSKKLNLKLKILEVTKGDKYADTAITEIFFKGDGCM